MPLIRPGDPEPSVILMRSGFAFRSCRLGDGRRAILNIVTPSDFIGLDHIVLHREIRANKTCPGFVFSRDKLLALIAALTCPS